MERSASEFIVTIQTDLYDGLELNSKLKQITLTIFNAPYIHCLLMPAKLNHSKSWRRRGVSGLPVYTKIATTAFTPASQVEKWQRVSFTSSLWVWPSIWFSQVSCFRRGNYSDASFRVRKALDALEWQAACWKQSIFLSRNCPLWQNPSTF